MSALFSTPGDWRQRPSSTSSLRCCARRAMSRYSCEQLLAMRQAVAGGVATHTQDSFTLGLDGTQDVGDDAANTATRQLLLGLGERDRELIYQIDTAVDRLDDGTYGICDECGDEIGVARLRALPHADLCVECKAIEEQLSRT